MGTIMVVPAIFDVAKTTNFLEPVPAETRWQPAAFNTYPRSIIVVGPVVISIAVEVIIITNVYNIVGRPH
jgi:hypothetical protein